MAGTRPAGNDLAIETKYIRIQILRPGRSLVNGTQAFSRPSLPLIYIALSIH